MCIIIVGNIPIWKSVKQLFLNYVNGMNRKLLTAILIVALIAIFPFLPGPSILAGYVSIMFFLIFVASILIFFVSMQLILFGFNSKIKLLKRFVFYGATLSTIFLVITIWVTPYIWNYSLNFAIWKGDQVIDAIELFYSEMDEYPEGLIFVEQPKYKLSSLKPGVINIRNFDYERCDKGYVLSFKNICFAPFIHDIIEYRKNCEDLKNVSYTDDNKYNSPNPWKNYYYD